MTTHNERHIDEWGACWCTCRACRSEVDICICLYCVECNGDTALELP